MMKAMFAVFVAMAIFGFATGHIGGALLAVLMSGFVIYSARELRKRDIEFYTHPRSAQPIPDPLEVLHEQGSEGTRSTF
jgi:hypothetical protein